MHNILFQFPTLLRMSIGASVLILLALTAQALCGARLKPGWRSALWLLVLVRLALPSTVPSPLSFFNLVKLTPQTSSVAVELRPVQSTTASAPSTTVPSSGPATRHINWLAWLWTTGVISLAGCAFTSQYRFHNRVKKLRPVTDGPTLHLLEDCKELMAVRTPVFLIETDAVECPAVFGFIRPRILLPQGLISTFASGELRHVFLHELAHIKRKDILIGWLALGLQMVHWFNPLVWLAFYRLRIDRELACDALVLSRSNAGENEAYGLTMVKLLESFGQAGLRPGVAGILEKKQQMKRRINMIAKFKKTDRGLVLATLVLVGIALVTLTDAQNSTRSPATNAATPGKPDAANGVWAVRFEPVGDFAPKTPGEFLSKIHVYSGQSGEIGYFRTTKKGDKLVGSFLAFDGELLKAELSKIPELKVTAVEKLNQEQLEAYEKSPQESFIDFQKPDVAKGVWAVRFEPVGDFSPRTPGEFLAKIPIYSGQSGEIGYFRTTKKGDKLVGAFLAYDGELLKAALSKIPELKVTAVEKLNQEQLEAYEKWPQESLIDFGHPDAAKGVWAVRFEPAGDFAPKTPEEFLARIPIYSGQSGEIGYFRTIKKGDRLVGSFLAYDGDQLKAALSKIPELKVTTVEKLNQEQLEAYEKSAQESF